jgi:putative copper export protein
MDARLPAPAWLSGLRRRAGAAGDGGHVGIAGAGSAAARRPPVPEPGRRPPPDGTAVWSRPDAGHHRHGSEPALTRRPIADAAGRRAPSEAPGRAAGGRPRTRTRARASGPRHRAAATATPAAATARRGRDLREAVTVSIWLTIALVIGWVALVVVRSPAADAGDQLAARIDLAIAETLLAERVQSFAYWICSVCTLLVIGGTIFRFFVIPPHIGVVGPDGVVHAQTRRPGGGNVAESTLRGAAVVGIVAAAFLVPLRTIALSGGRISAAQDTGLLWFVLNSRFGDSAVLRIAGLSILLLALADGPRLWRGGAARAGRAGRESVTDRATRRRATFVAGTLVVLIGYALTGHPQATDPWLVHVAAQWVHVTVAAAWFGGVAFLGIELRQQWRKGSARYTGEVVARFSSLAEVTIVVAAVTGVLLANSQIHDPTAVLQSAYGRAFVGKMVALGAVLAVGGYNQQRLVPAIVDRDEQSAWDHLRRSLVVEVTLVALGVLLMTAAMTSGGI